MKVMEQLRVNGATRPILEYYFQLFYEMLTLAGIDLENIYNMDKTGVLFGMQNKIRCIIDLSVKNRIQKSAQTRESTLTHVTSWRTSLWRRRSAREPTTLPLGDAARIYVATCTTDSSRDGVGEALVRQSMRLPRRSEFGEPRSGPSSWIHTWRRLLARRATRKTMRQSQWSRWQNCECIQRLWTHDGVSHQGRRSGGGTTAAAPVRLARRLLKDKTTRQRADNASSVNGA